MDTQGHIRVLPAHVANKIAAGEVVDRPASVLKELMENALDAGASHVDVTVVAGGRKLIAVTDDGSGMGRDDALLSLERHATSKIRDVDDIEQINTLGFRGEAMAAIASVSRFRLATCLKGELAGTEITITGGTIRDVRDFGCPPGTTIEVRDLFFNVPARRKFLRTYQTELSHVRAGFVVQALARPAMGMSLTADGRETYRLSAGGGLEDRLRDLFGTDFRKSLKPVDFRLGSLAVTGFVSVPAVSRSDRGEQYIFVNGRATSAPLLAYAIREGYHTLLPNGRHPSIFLFISMDPSLVDVNVHPTKKEVRFRQPSEVRDLVIVGIRRALGHEEPGSAVAAETISPQEPSPRLATHGELKIEDLPATRTFRYPRMSLGNYERPSARPPPGMAPPSDAPGPGLPQPVAVPPPGSEPEPASRGGDSPWAWCRVVGQIGGLYVVLETEDGYVTMDPHAAHERVLFEKYMSDILNGSTHTQSLLLPETVELSPKDALRVSKHLDVLTKMGFGVSSFGGDTFVVDALPSYFADTATAPLLVDVAHSLEVAGARGAKGRWREEAIAQAACKASVKARDKLDLAEIEKLVIELARTEMPYTCPHGRPTLIFTSFTDLNKKFGRE